MAIQVLKGVNSVVIYGAMKLIFRLVTRVGIHLLSSSLVCRHCRL